jgi:hypothetical protein
VKLAIAALTVVILATLASLLFGIPTQSGNQVEVRPTENNQQFPTARPATPTEVTRPTPTIRPSSIDKDIVISGWKCTLQEYVDSVLFEGTVKNISPRTYSFVRIRVAVFDNAGNLRNTNTSYIESDVLIPNATSSFKAYVDNNGGTKCAVVIESGILEK